MKKITTFTTQELFEDFSNIYNEYGTINKTLYLKKGKYTSKDINNTEGFLNLIRRYNQQKLNLFTVKETKFVHIQTDRSHSEQTKNKISLARLANRKGNCTFTKEEAILKGEEYWKQTNIDFSAKDFLAKNNYNKECFYELFGTFTNFKKSLSCWNNIYQSKCNVLKTRPTLNKPTKEKILQIAKNLFNTSGILRMDELMKSANCSQYHIQKTVGKLPQIKQLLGINNKQPLKKEQDIEIKQLFKTELERIYKVFQNDQTTNKFTLQYFLSHADKQLTAFKMKKYYGSFAKFVKAYGIKPYQNEFTKESILERSFELYHKYGKFNTKIQRSKEANLPQSAVDRFFGSFNGLLKEMGLEPNMNKRITKNDILADLSSIVKKYGVISETIIINESKYSLPTILKHFNHSLNNVYQELNILNNLSSQMSQTGTYCILKIAEILNQKPEFEKQFSWLKNNKPLFLDGYFKNLNLAIEYDGPRHFSNEKFLSASQRAIENDEIKNKLCKEHGIKLIRISYKESLSTKNLKNILKQNNITI